MLHSEELRALDARLVLLFKLNRDCDGLGMWLGWHIKDACRI